MFEQCFCACGEHVPAEGVAEIVKRKEKKIIKPSNDSTREVGGMKACKECLPVALDFGPTEAHDPATLLAKLHFLP